MSTAEVINAAFSIADQAVVCDIETNAVTAGRDPAGRVLYDIRPMLDPREQPPEVIDMVTQSVAYATARGLIAATDAKGIVAMVRA